MGKFKRIDTSIEGVCIRDPEERQAARESSRTP